MRSGSDSFNDSLDIDECKIQNIMCKGGICENTPGSYMCTCPKGYGLAADQRTCTGNIKEQDLGVLWGFGGLNLSFPYSLFYNQVRIFAKGCGFAADEIICTGLRNRTRGKFPLLYFCRCKLVEKEAKKRNYNTAS